MTYPDRPSRCLQTPGLGAEGTGGLQPESGAPARSWGALTSTGFHTSKVCNMGTLSQPGHIITAQENEVRRGNQQEPHVLEEQHFIEVLHKCGKCYFRSTNLRKRYQERLGADI